MPTTVGRGQRAEQRVIDWPIGILGVVVLSFYLLSRSDWQGLEWAHLTRLRFIPVATEGRKDFISASEDEVTLLPQFFSLL